MKTGHLVWLYGTFPAIVVDIGRVTIGLLPLDGYAEHEAGKVFYYQKNVELVSVW
jgi:hypothetical protein